MKIAALICVLGLWSTTSATVNLQAQVEQAHLLLEHDAQTACTALQAVVEAPQRGPWTEPALLLFAECSLRLGDLDRADSLWADLEKRGGPAAYAARYHRAELLYFRGDFAAATAALAEPRCSRPEPCPRQRCPRPTSHLRRVRRVRWPRRSQPRSASRAARTE